MGNTITSDEYSCIGGEEWFKVCLLVRSLLMLRLLDSVLSELYRFYYQWYFFRFLCHRSPLSKKRPLRQQHKPEHPTLRSETRRMYVFPCFLVVDRFSSIDIEYIRDVALRSMSGVLDKKSTNQYEKAHLEVCSLEQLSIRSLGTLIDGPFH